MIEPVYNQSGVTIYHGLNTLASLVDLFDFGPCFYACGDDFGIQGTYTSSQVYGSCLFYWQIFQSADLKRKVGLTSFDPEVWAQIGKASSCDPVGGGPYIDWASVPWSLPQGNRSAPIFFEQIDCLGSKLGNADKFAECFAVGKLTIGCLPADRYKAVRVHDSCQVSEYKFVFHSDIISPLGHDRC